jgi:NitT/TauT family transport system substrate-binding protein
MSDKKLQATLQQTRRAFLKYASAGMLLPTVLGVVPQLVSGKAYAQSEKKISNEWLELAAKYGKPTGKFGKIGDPITLTVGYQPYGTPYWTATLNKQAKIFAKYLPKGSEVVWFRALSGPLINNNLFTGKNQFGYMAETPALKAGELIECDLVSLIGYDIGETVSLCVADHLLKSEKVKTATDLNQQKIATVFGSYAHRQILTWSEQNEVQPELINQSIEQMLASLRTKSVAAVAVWEPYASWMEMQGIATRWVTGQDMPCTCHHYFPEVTPHTFRVAGATLAIHDWLQERPDIIAAYLKSEEECRDMLTHDPDLAAYYIWTDISEIPPAIIRTVLEMMVWDGRITTEVAQHLQGCARMWRKKGFLDKERSQDPDKYVAEWADDRYLRLAIEEMQAEGFWTSANQPGFPLEIKPEQLKRHDWHTYEKIKLTAKPWQQTKVK